MITLSKKLILKYKLSISVFETLNQTAYSTQSRALGTSGNIVNKILSHNTFCDSVLPIILGNNKLNSNWEREKSDYISSIQISVPTTGLTLDLNSTFDLDNSNTKQNIKEYILENKLYSEKDNVITYKSEKDIVDHILSNKQVLIIDLHKYFKFNNAKDYLYWVICDNSSQVSNTTEDVNKSSNIRFFLYDERIARKINMDNSKLEIKAITKLEAIRQQPDANVLLKSIAITKNVVLFDELEELDDETIYLMVYKYCKENASEFLTVAEDDTIKIQSKIKLYINTNILSVDNEGTIVETNNPTNIIGKDTKSSVSYFKNPINKAELLKFESQYKSLKHK